MCSRFGLRSYAMCWSEVTACATWCLVCAARPSGVRGRRDPISHLNRTLLRRRHVAASACAWMTYTLLSEKSESYNVHVNGITHTHGAGCRAVPARLGRGQSSCFAVPRLYVISSACGFQRGALSSASAALAPTPEPANVAPEKDSPHRFCPRLKYWGVTARGVCVCVRPRAVAAFSPKTNVGVEPSATATAEGATTAGGSPAGVLGAKRSDQHGESAR